MALNIVAVDAKEMNRARILNRSKSPAMQLIYRSIFELESGDAKSIQVEFGDEFEKIRTMLAACAKRAGIDLWVVPDRPANRIMFTLKDPTATRSIERQVSSAAPTPPRDQEEMRQRSNAIREAAIELGLGNPVVSAQEVVDHLRGKGTDLDVPRPTTSVSAVMRNMTEFERTDKGQFRYVAY